MKGRKSLAKEDQGLWFLAGTHRSESKGKKEWKIEGNPSGLKGRAREYWVGSGTLEPHKKKREEPIVLAKREQGGGLWGGHRGVMRKSCRGRGYLFREERCGVTRRVLTIRRCVVNEQGKPGGKREKYWKKPLLLRMRESTRGRGGRTRGKGTGKKHWKQHNKMAQKGERMSGGGLQGGCKGTETIHGNFATKKIAS